MPTSAEPLARVARRFLATIAIFAACSASPNATGIIPHLEAQPLAVHGMLMFGLDGRGEFVLSHLGMYHSPHQFQILFDASFDGPEANGLRADWMNEVDANPDAFHTVVPGEFSLSDVAVSLAAGRRFAFSADIVRGHFERGGITVERDVPLALTRVRFWRLLDASEPKPPHAVYLLFSIGATQYVAHRIAGAPDFDEIAELADTGGVPVEFGAREFVAPELAADAQLQAGSQLLLAGGTDTVTATVARVIYRETQDFQSSSDGTRP